MQIRGIDLRIAILVLEELLTHIVVEQMILSWEQQEIIVGSIGY